MYVRTIVHDHNFDGTLLALIKMSSNLKQVKQDYYLTIALKLVINLLTVCI